MPLTRKTIAGWTAVTELEQEGQKNLESQNGLCVIEKTRANRIQVRHGVSTNPTDLISREWSIIGQQDAMVYRLRDYLESDNLIGQPIYPYTLTNVKGSADAALQSLIRDGLIRGLRRAQGAPAGHQPRCAGSELPVAARLPAELHRVHLSASP
jgi:hypothetical protein